MTTTQADSTVAFTAYNLLTLTNGVPVAPDEIISGARAQHAGLSMEQLVRSMDALVAKSYIGKNPDGTYFCRDALRRRVMKRSRADADVQDEDGNFIGGWTGWELGMMDPKRPCAPQKFIPIEEALSIE